MANQYTKLFIDNQEVDLFDTEELPLNITKRVNNIQGSVQGDYSRASVTVPATKNNINILLSLNIYFAPKQASSTHLNYEKLNLII